VATIVKRVKVEKVELDHPKGKERFEQVIRRVAKNSQRIIPDGMKTYVLIWALSVSSWQGHIKFYQVS
jgi:hypothetical protein